MFVSALSLVAFAAAASFAAKPNPSNGGFEAGFKGWQHKSPEHSGDWIIYKKGDSPGTLRSRGMGPGLADYYDPPRGKRAAVTEQSGPGVRFLHRRLKLKAHSKIKLKLFAFYQNYAGSFATPHTFDSGVGMVPPRGGGGGSANQQFRIDVMRPAAPLDSLKGRDVLVRVFRTDVGDKNRRKPFRLKVDLSKYAGDRVRLRMAEVDNLGNFAAGVDAIKLKQKPLD